MRVDEIIQGITGLGLGSGLGAIITAVIAARSNRGRARAEAVDLITASAERVVKLNEPLVEEVRTLRAAVDDAYWGVVKYLDGEISRDELLALLKILRTL